jgi:hypothetical protein
LQGEKEMKKTVLAMVIGILMAGPVCAGDNNSWSSNFLSDHQIESQQRDQQTAQRQTDRQIKEMQQRQQAMQQDMERQQRDSERRYYSPNAR